MRAVQVREHQKYEEWTTCLFLLRADGSVDDVSARKCVARLFPAWGATRGSNFSKARALPRLRAGHGVLGTNLRCTLSPRASHAFSVWMTALHGSYDNTNAS